jgi:hypothetical protein
LIAIEYAKDSWPRKGTSEVQSAAIIIWGTLGESVTIDDAKDGSTDKYPPISLRGVGPVNTGVIRANGSYPVLSISTGAQVSLEASLTLIGGSSSKGGGVYIKTTDSSRPAAFTMKEGIITGNTSTAFGGGVYVDSGCSFVMSGGTISNNTASWGGGVSVSSGTFTMSGGTISDNTFGNAGGGVCVQDAGFTMSGGSITRNIATGSATNAGAVYVTGTSESIFTLEDGVISDNESGHSGGAVYINFACKMIMNGGTISRNKSLGGGGVTLINQASFTMNSGTISDNEAVFGGGVCTYDPSGSFTMKGGTISGNTATDNGGGVFVNSGGATFKKEPAISDDPSGIIYGYNPGNPNSNKVQNSSYGIMDNKGHAVYIADGPKTRETTVTAYESLDSAVADADGGWTE